MVNKQVKSISNRDRLLEAATLLLREHGFAGTSPAAVLKESGVGQGSLYHHFPNKKALAVAALVAAGEAMRAEFDAQVAGELPVDVRLGRFLRARRPGKSNSLLGRMAVDAAVLDEDVRAPIAAYFSHLERAIAAMLAEAQRNGRLPDDVVCGDVAVALVAVLEGGYVLSRALDDAAEIERSAQGALYMLRSMLGTVERPGLSSTPALRRAQTVVANHGI